MRGSPACCALRSSRPRLPQRWSTARTGPASMAAGYSPPAPSRHAGVNSGRGFFRTGLRGEGGGSGLQRVRSVGAAARTARWYCDGRRSCQQTTISGRSDAASGMSACATTSHQGFGIGKQLRGEATPFECARSASLISRSAGPSPSAVRATSGSRSSRVRNWRSSGRLADSTRATGVSPRSPAATDRVTMVFRARAVEKFLLWDGLASICAAGEVKDAARPHFVLEVPASALRYQRALVYPIEPRDRARQSKSNPGLIALLQEARKAQALMDSRRDLSLVQAARVYRRGPNTFARILRLNYLAPDIVAAILDGTQPLSLHRKKLLLCTLPMDWALQRKLLGFDARGDAMDPRVERAERLQQRQQDKMRTAELQSGALRLESVHQTEVIEE